MPVAPLLPSFLRESRATLTRLESMRRMNEKGLIEFAGFLKDLPGQKYVFLFFWKEKNPQTDKAWNVLQPAVANMAGSAEVASIQITDPAEKRIVR